MGLLVQLAELLARLSVLTPLLERYMRSNRPDSRGASNLQESITELSTAHAALGSSLQDGLKEQHLRLARLEDSMARVVNRLAELSNDREKLDAGLRQLKGLLRITLVAAIVAVALLLIGIALIFLRGQ